MKPYGKAVIIVTVSVALLFLYAVFPRPSRALRPLDDQSLITYSPKTVVKASETAAGGSDVEHPQFTHVRFEHSVCFLQCHHQHKVSPADKTQKQWRLLIEDNGHDIFRPIQWESPEQKKVILNFLLQHARDAGPDTEGIGVW